MAIPNVGDEMIDAILFDLNGDEHKLSDYKGKYILIDFWSLTCFSCMNAAKELKSIHEQYGDKINIVGINMDPEKGMWEQGTNRDGIVWANLSDGKGSEEGVGKAYGIMFYPAYALFDPEGTMIDRWMGHKPGRFREKLEENIPDLFQ